MKKILIIGGLLALFGAAVGFYFYNKPHQNIRSAKADFTVTATELFNAFETDETAANEKYLGKIIEVTGTVQEVKKDEEGKTGVTLEGGGMMFGVICKLDDFSEPKRTEFTQGEQVTLKGECTGMLMDVVLVRCVEM
jgi:hypothetical protein